MLQSSSFWTFKKMFLDFFDVDHFWSLYWICHNIASILCFVFLAAKHMGS